MPVRSGGHPTARGEAEEPGAPSNPRAGRLSRERRVATTICVDQRRTASVLKDAAQPETCGEFEGWLRTNRASQGERSCSVWLAAVGHASPSRRPFVNGQAHRDHPRSPGAERRGRWIGDLIDLICAHRPRRQGIELASASFSPIAQPCRMDAKKGSRARCSRGPPCALSCTFSLCLALFCRGGRRYLLSLDISYLYLCCLFAVARIPPRA